MNKYAALALASVLLAACAIKPAETPPPVVAVVKNKQPFPPRPLTLLYTSFQDHAVLQRDKPLPVWGKAASGAKVTVQFAGQSATATADASGHWQVQFPAQKAGGPYTLTAASDNGESQTVSDVFLGDVYLCSGQSNMELPLRLATNYDGELYGATNTQLRLFHVQRHSSAAPKSVFGADASWAVTSPETAKEFSATCYYFGREVQPAAGVAVGLIEDAWGGSAIQAWISNETLEALGGYSQAIDAAKTYAKDPKLAEIKWRAMARNWFESHDPALKAAPTWNDPALDDTGWNSHAVTGTWRLWDVPELKTFNGVLWLRKTITLSPADAQGDAALSLGPIDSEDMAWVNGKEIGAGYGYDVNRVYTVPAGVLHEGANVIAIAVQSGAGILWPAEKMGLKTAAGKSVSLAGPWRWKPSITSDKTGSAPYMPWLNQFGTSVLYNGMIEPLGPTHIRGVVWYQGETDAWQPKEYGRLLKALIEDWRSRFGADTPFFIVQLPGFGPAAAKPVHSDWALMRDTQRTVAAAVPNTGLAVTTDLGVPDNIHPQQKQEVGRRLALLARKMVYGQDVAISPAPVSAERKGKTVTVTFEHTGKGLETREWDRVIGFSLCDGPGNCRFTDGIVHQNTVTLKIADHTKPVRVRFCWADSPLCNLVNSAGLPATPFELPLARP